MVQLLDECAIDEEQDELNSANTPTVAGGCIKRSSLRSVGPSKQARLTTSKEDETATPPPPVLTPATSASGSSKSKEQSNQVSEHSKQQQQQKRYHLLHFIFSSLSGAYLGGLCLPPLVGEKFFVLIFCVKKKQFLC